MKDERSNYYSMWEIKGQSTLYIAGCVGSFNIDYVKGKMSAI